MLVKFSLSHAKIEKIPEKNFVMINKDGGGGEQVLDFMRDITVMRGDIELKGGPPSPH